MTGRFSSVFLASAAEWYCSLLGAGAPGPGVAWSTVVRGRQLSGHQTRRMSTIFKCQRVFGNHANRSSVTWLSYKQPFGYIIHEECSFPPMKTAHAHIATARCHACSTPSGLQTPLSSYHPFEKFNPSGPSQNLVSLSLSPFLIPSLARKLHTDIPRLLLPIKPHHSNHSVFDCLSIIRAYATWPGPSSKSQWRKANRSTVTYMTAIVIAVVGLSYAAVPLYRLFCQASGYGGTVAVVDPSDKVEQMKPIRERVLTIRFNADTSAGMQWQFKPDQKEIKVVPGETALAFYTARNPTDKPVTGISTYNVIPFEAGLYFNKIQCFCFEEQRLNPREEVDMPVFFYIDPDFNDDPAMAKVDTITLSYTFFESRDGDFINLPVPSRQV